MRLSVIPSHLTGIDLSNNRLTHLPDGICALPLLESLIVSNNCLEQLPENIFSMRSLKLLYVAHNRLRALPAKFNKCHIQLLEAQCNELAALPSNFFESNLLLRSLNISRNRISCLPDLADIAELTDLEEIYAGGNDLGADSLAKCTLGRVRSTAARLPFGPLTARCARA